MTKAQAVQTQLDMLSDWIAELGENFDDDFNHVVPFEQSAKLAAALKLHCIDDPHTAWTVFTARAEALSDLRDRLQVASEYHARGERPGLGIVMGDTDPHSGFVAIGFRDHDGDHYPRPPTMGRPPQGMILLLTAQSGKHGIV